MEHHPITRLEGIAVRLTVLGEGVMALGSAKMFTSFPDILVWILAAFKAEDDIRFLTLFQGVLGLHQSDAERVSFFIKHVPTTFS